MSMIKATGCAFNLDEILMNFPYDKLKVSCKECYNIIGNNHRNFLVKRLFLQSVELILNDIIDNNITFWLPVSGKVKCNIHMKRTEGEAFQNLRKTGKWKGVDFIASMFCGYELGFYMLGNRTPRVKNIYVNKSLKDKITINTNNSKSYGDGNVDKTIKDYYEWFYEQYPTLLKSDIHRILKFAWKSIYLHNSYGGDTIIFNKNFWCYIGNLRKDPLEHFYYYIKKLTIKLRVIYKRQKIKWDGYYYFALSDYQYQSYLEQKNKRGRPKKYFNFGSVCLYQILDECKINEFNKKYIFRIKYLSDFGMKKIVQDLKTGIAEFILERNPLKFKDILINENEYEFL